MTIALALPPALERRSDRAVMLLGAATLSAALIFTGLMSRSEPVSWTMLLAVWFVMGLGYAAILTPSGRLLRRSAHPEDRPALFAAQFALSHACWLVTYPLAGWLGAQLGMGPVMIVLGMVAALGFATALLLWPAHDPEILAHLHDNLPPDHPHVRGAEPTRHGLRHAHALVIDERHRRWPTH